MAIELVEEEIERFLSTPEPEVICLVGHWGVGKTYAWNKYLGDAKNAKKIALPRYSYNSLFGIGSLQELKYSIFENSLNAADIGTVVNLKSIETNVIGSLGAAGKKLTKQIVGAAHQTPFLKNYLGGIAPVWFAMVTETIVCIDDLERRGKDLSVRDVLGLINNLKELKKCKVCLILNDEALESEAAEFQKYIEKVVDARLKFEPSPTDSVRIALASTDAINGLLTKFCVQLGISNIRIIKKIERALRKVEPLLKDFDHGVLEQAAHSLALLGWCIYEPTKAPPLDFLKRRSVGEFLLPDKQNPMKPNEVAWNALLGSYSFGSIDEFDSALLGGLENGYFDPSAVKASASKLDKNITSGNLAGQFASAWDRYHASFDDNQVEVLDSIYDSFMRGTEYISPTNMSSTISVFKELGESGKADEMLKQYIDRRGNEPSLFDIDHFPFPISDPDVIKAFQQKFATFKKEFKPTDVILRISETNSWNPDDVTLLAKLPVDDYRIMFKATKGRELRKIIQACLMFGSMGTTDANYNAVAQKARQALKIIGGECPINARRVKGYGISAGGESVGSDSAS